jgi:YfiH family protein
MIIAGSESRLTDKDATLQYSNMKQSGFILRERQGVPFYSCSAFENLPRLRHGFSTRHGCAPPSHENSFNLGDTSWDSPERVKENQYRFLSALDLEGAQLATLHQIHSDRVHIISDSAVQWNRPEGDALITRSENVALAVRTADCLPILIADPVNNAIAVVHSGWRGTLSRILTRTIRDLQQAFGSDPKNILVAVGPGIRACCFEVGIDVADLFNNEYPGDKLAVPKQGHAGKFYVNLPGALEVQLRSEGVCADNCYDLGICTCCNTNQFFSYRAQGPESGRSLAVIGKIRSA